MRITSIPSEDRTWPPFNRSHLLMIPPPPGITIPRTRLSTSEPLWDEFKPYQTTVLTVDTAFSSYCDQISEEKALKSASVYSGPWLKAAVFCGGGSMVTEAAFSCSSRSVKLLTHIWEDRKQGRWETERTGSRENRK